MRLGFVIDQTKCIGCHACTVACKSENGVPLGSFRTWVKYIEKGSFPDTSRYFSVLRCNQCDDAPCIEICPTNALFRRKDGIVDFDNQACIGCKSCMQACPYDALYIDPLTQTAAKCHFCAHRTEIGLAPACAVVCPTQAIIPGDFDDFTSKVSKIIATTQVSVRKPEQGTKPKVFYVGADAASLSPSIDRARGEFTFAQRPEGEYGGESAPVREVYDVEHETPWGWRVWSYLWTKSIAAGSVLVGAILLLMRLGDRPLCGFIAPLLGIMFIGLTSALLVLDLKRPERFYYMFLRPNWRSWLVWGGLILTAFGLLSTVWLIAVWLDRLHGWFLWPSIPLAALAAGYTAFLFWQCEGRDFWQSPILLPDLLCQAVLAGAASLLLFSSASDDGTRSALFWALAIGVAGHLLCAASELESKRGNVDLRRASQWMLARADTWRDAFGLGVCAPLVGFALTFVFGPSYWIALPSALAALYGLYQFERLWIQAGQSVPLS